MPYYLSIVLCGRNDDYGRDYLQRLQTLISNLDFLCAQYSLPCQVVFVEWNPPPDRPPIKSAIHWGSHLGVKIVTVPAAIDAQLPANRGRSGLHEFVAKNAGIRRADGQFVLSCTSDLLFSPDLFQFLAQRQLASDAVYRTARVNVRALPNTLAAPQALDWCRREVVSADVIGGRFGLNFEVLDHLRNINAFSLIGFDLQIREMFDFTHDLQPLRVEAPILRHFPLLTFTNGAGDFTLLSRDTWHSLGGYLENDCRNHVDAWFSLHAARQGLAVVLLPMRMCIFHQEHHSPNLLPFEPTIATLARLLPTPHWGLATHNLPTELLQPGQCGPPNGTPTG